MRLLENIRGRIGAAIGAGVAAICFLVGGAALAFWLSPQQAMEWRRIEGLPELDAAGYTAVSTGDDVAITGTLVDNPSQTDDGLVAYIQERWDVSRPSSSDNDSNSRPTGSWTTIETVIPALTISIAGGNIKTVAASSGSLGGAMHQSAIKQGTSTEKAEYEGRQLPEGSTRLRGFNNGDLVTVVGKKASTGDLIPDRLFGGDRVQLVENIRSGARVMFAIGIGMMICSPIVLVLGVLGGLFGRRKST
ncbi:MAG: hypothetical protein JXB07_18460 [Anaerolineae bacterium]|nr:hypothetical protein [Anaerolineae bacterium]